MRMNIADRKTTYVNGVGLRWFGAVLLLVLLVTTFCTLCSSTSAAGAAEFGIQKDSGKLEIGFVTVGPVSDWGWNYQHNQGRLGLEARMGGQAHTVIVENIPENADAERVMERMADAGAKLIVSTSYGYADFCMKAAKKNPGVQFIQAQAPVEGSNAATFNGAIWEASYVAGVVAAKTAKGVKRFGFVGAHPIPPINWTVNAFILGAQSVDPQITVDVVYTNSWYNPAAETEAVKSLAAKGVKLVYALVDSTLAAVKAAEREGIFCISHHADLSEFAPTKYVTGAVWKWSKLYEDVAKQIIAGTYQAKPIAGGLKEGYVGLASFGPAVNGETQKKARQVIAEIASGKRKVFAGPIYDNGGKLRVAKGTTLNVGEIVSMGWLAKGVRGAPTK